jgi:hypothetical protein
MSGGFFSTNISPVKRIKSIMMPVWLGLAFASASAAADLSPEQARSIAKDAYIYGYTLVDSYRILHAYNVDQANPEYKGPWNHLQSIGRVFTPEDKAVQTPLDRRDILS